MICLALDTAGPNCAVAIACDEDGQVRILAKIVEKIDRGHAERLMPMIAESLQHAGIGYQDLDRIAVARGPGTFTGIRIGVAAARGLALALNIPAHGIDALAAILHSVGGSSESANIAALDARRDRIYVRAETAGEGVRLLDSQCISADAAAAQLADCGIRSFCIFGDGGPILADRMAGDLELTIAPAIESAPIEEVAALGLCGLGVEPATPLYLRDADAKPRIADVIMEA